MINLTAGPSEQGSRLDRFLRKRLPLQGLSGIYGLIRRGAVRVNGKKVRQDYRLNEGDALYIDVNEAELDIPAGPQSSLAGLIKTDFFRRNFNLMHEDPSIIVCNKPAGLVVHSGSGHGHHDNLIDLATAFVVSKEMSRGKDPASIEPPVLTHRLDRDTSGVILLAKNRGVVRKLHADMRDGKFAKQYIAVCHNRPPEYEGTIALGMKRRESGKSGMKMGVDKNGAAAVTAYKIVSYQNNLSKLEIQLDTGKTHQIRVHMSHVGAPILGDERYGDLRLDDSAFSAALEKGQDIPFRLYLHAHKLSFPHPKTGKPTTFTAPVPKEFSLF